MGKAKKIKVSQKQKNEGLETQIAKEEFATPSGREKVRKPRQEEQEDVVPEHLSQRIIKEARRQVQELEDEVGPSKGSKRKTVQLSVPGDSDSEGDVSDEEAIDMKNLGVELEVDARDESMFELFMNKDSAPRRTLAEIIQEKLTEKATEIDTQYSDAGSQQLQNLDPRVKELYEGVGKILAKYRSGKVPKAFKVIAQFNNWEQLLLLTEPYNWSAAAVYQATRIFTANLKEKMAQRFFNLLLLPRVRDDIDTYHRLNFHLYQAIHKALFKPGAFFKGFLLPLCESGTCTLREAIIIGSVIGKHSIPVMHASAAMLRIAEMDYSGANSIFLRIFFDKKYALPYRVIDSAVFHFLKFRFEKRELPVLWHQAFLTFIQRYKSDISSEQKESLLELLKIKPHPHISAEIRRELQFSKCRDQEMDEPMQEPI